MGTVNANAAETSQQVAALPEKTNPLLRIIRDNFNTQYASQAASLAEFRDAVSAHSGTEVDAILLADFRAHVPLSNYDSYKPFVDKFNAQPCKEEDVINMFSPGFPDFFARSSATSGSNPKVFPRYNHNARLNMPSRPFFYTDNKDPIAALICTEYRDVKVLERASGEVVQRIPVCIASGGLVRRSLGWHIDDESRMSVAMSGAAAPWAATVIGYVPSFLTIHGLFFLAHRNVCFVRTVFATQFVDLIRCIDEHWDMLVSCIRDGILPDVQGIDHVREYLQAHFHPNPERAGELLEIGPPFSFEGWFARVWPKADGLVTICSGPFATVLPKVRSILGPNVSIRGCGYDSSEGSVGILHDVNKLDEFVLLGDDIVEFLDVSLDATHENLCQAWEVEVGKHYEPVLTTRDGLWRYRLGDVVHIIGVHMESNSPLFKVIGRRSLTIRVPFIQVIDDQLLAAIQNLTSEGTIQVHEFTTVLDDRALQPAVGFFIELAGPLGPSAHAVPRKLFDALVANHNGLQPVLELGRMRLPTVRIVKTGTFSEYRQWKGERMNVGFGQIKVPLVLLDPAVREWISERVVQEL
ncbi:GH3 auxin-responsive promoter-domain-containing protein [Boletus edulis]|nr:GH3 auxin-responsive promoter-domain-containing protein [Boletus edulis]